MALERSPRAVVDVPNKVNISGKASNGLDRPTAVLAQPRWVAKVFIH